ncbi:MAG: HDOD domain-containing protein [Thermodesulfobacteriota bacterium]|nr:HDOD domain-containing protein [Thermodesulfobacteriota bacterium]
MKPIHLQTMIAIKLAILLAAGFVFINIFTVTREQNRFIDTKHSESRLLSLAVARNLEYMESKRLTLAPEGAETLTDVFNASEVDAATIVDDRHRILYASGADSDMQSGMTSYAARSVQNSTQTTDFYGTAWGVFRPRKSHMIISIPILGENGKVLASVSTAFDLGVFYAVQRREHLMLGGYGLVGILLLTLLGTWGIGAGIVTPVRNLIKGVNHYQSGTSIDASVVGRNREFHQLIAALNGLLERIFEERSPEKDDEAAGDDVQQVATATDRIAEKPKRIKVSCGGCGKGYTIAEDRLPDKERVIVACPSCRNRITIDRKKPSASGQLNDSPPLPPETASPSPATAGSNVSSIQRPPTELSAAADYTFIDEGPADPAAADQLRKKILQNTAYLPPMPQVVYKARQVFADPDSNFRNISEILEMDQAIASRVLKMANSAYYGMQGQVSSIHQASVLLGIRTLGELITVAGAAEMLEKKLTGYDFSSGLLWRHSLAVANSAEMIAGKIMPEIKDDAFFAGLIHDAGKLMLDPFILEKRDAVAHFLENHEKTFLAVERHVLGVDHAQVSYDLCRQWNIPDVQAVAIQYHHDPAASVDNPLAYILHLSDWIAMSAGFGADFQALMHRMDPNTMDILALTKEDTEEIMGRVKNYVTSVAKDMQEG